MNILQILKRLNACSEAISWIEQQPEQLTAQQIYESMDSALWCGWLCERLTIGQNFIDAWETDMRGKPVFMKFVRDEHDLLGWKLFADQRAKIRSWREGLDTVARITRTQENLLIVAIYQRKLNKLIDDYNKDIDKLFRIDNFVEKHRPPWSVVEQALQTIIKEEQ